MSKDKKNGNGNGGKKSMKGRAPLKGMSPDDIRSGIHFALPLLSLVAGRTKTKVDDALVAFLEIAGEPGNLEKIYEALEV